MDQLSKQDTQQARPTFEDALAELQSDHANLPGPTVLYGLSGMDEAQLAALSAIWEDLDATYRRVLMQMLVDAVESDFELDYKALGYANLTAPQPQVRQAAIELLAFDESDKALERLMTVAHNDPDTAVRAEAVRLLGRFVLDTEVGRRADDALGAKLQDMLLSIINASDESVIVRANAIESLANCTREDLPPIIKAAYSSRDEYLRRSAIVAMGNSCDTRWEQQVLAELDNSDEVIRREAVRAAGKLGIQSAVDGIIAVMEDGDRDDQEVAIFALGEIGGQQATSLLERLLDAAEENEDDELATLLDEAIANASLVNGDLMLLDFDEDDLLDMNDV